MERFGGILTVRHRANGFSLVEILIVLVIFSAFIMAALLNGSQGIKQADTKGVADIVAASLRAARQQAMTSSVPVALVIPSGDGTKPHSQSFYLVTGQNPHLESVTNLAPEHPNTCLAVGLTSEPSILDSSSLATNAESFDFRSWFIASEIQSDYTFCFLPDGSLVTNDLPVTDGAYQIVVSAGLDFSVASPPQGQGRDLPVSYFQITEVSSPQVVRVSPAGDISVRKSVTGFSTGSQLGFPVPPALPPSLTARGTGTPSLVEIMVFPKPDPNAVPPGVEALVDVDGHLVLKVVARDPDQERILYCRWTSAPGGAFSRPDSHQMRWEQNVDGSGDGAWVSNIVWRPPPGAEGGDQYTLSAEISDEAGGTDNALLGVSGIVQVVDNDKIVFESVRAGRQGLFSMLPDGSGVTRIGGPGERNPVVSPTGSHVVYSTGNSIFLRPIGGEPILLITQPPQPTGGPNPTAGLIEPECFDSQGTLLFWTVGNSGYVAPLRGEAPITTFHRLNDDPGFVDPQAAEGRKIDLAISPDRTKLVYDNGFHIFSADFDPNPAPGQPYLTGGNLDITVGFSAGDPGWSQDGSKLSFISDATGNLDAYTYDYSGGTFSNPVNISNSPAQEGFPSLSPDGSRIVYGSNRTGDWELFRADTNGTGEVNITNFPGNDVRPRWGR